MAASDRSAGDQGRSVLQRGRRIGHGAEHAAGAASGTHHEDHVEDEQRAEQRNTETAKIYDQLGLAEYEGIEATSRTYLVGWSDFDNLGTRYPNCGSARCARQCRRVGLCRQNRHWHLL